MGPYCRYCDRRCFVLRVLPDGIEAGVPVLMATCRRGMEHDLMTCDHTHLTALNPVTEPEAVEALRAMLRRGR